jgi:hypothetical protein
MFVWYGRTRGVTSWFPYLQLCCAGAFVVHKRCFVVRPNLCHVPRHLCRAVGPLLCGKSLWRALMHGNDFFIFTIPTMLLLVFVDF